LFRSLGEKELAAGRDPSFESVSSHFSAMKNPREVIGVKEHRDEFIIMPDARVAFTPSREGYYWRGYVAEKSGRAFFTLDDGDAWIGSNDSGLPAKKRLLDGYLPIVIADFERVAQFQPGLQYEQTAVAWSEGMSPDEPIWALIRMRVFNAGDEAREVNLSWNVDYGAKTARVFAEKRGGKPHKDNLKVRKVASWKFELAPGAEKMVYGKLPYLDGYEQAVESSAEEFDKRLAEASAFWKELLNKGIRIEVSEQRVNDAYRAWLGYTFLNVDKIGEMYEPHDGSGFYECILGIAASKYCNTLGLMGYPDEARKYLDSLGTLISPEGQFKVSFGSVDTGALLLVMANHYQLTGDESWLREAAPKMVKMCNWIIDKRKNMMAEQEKDSLVYGLISSNVGVDNPGADYSYVTDTALVVGMEAAAQALRAAEMEEDADRIEKESAAYRQDVVTSMRRAVVEHEGLKILPVMPQTHKYLKRAAYKTHVEAGPGEGYTGHGYYGLFGCMVLETKFLPASDESFRLIAELLERRDGLAMGMCTFGAKGGIDHAFTYGYWMNCLEREEVPRALLGFYGSLAYGMSRDTWAGVECTNMVTGANAATLPHLRSGYQQLRLLRNMLVREQAGKLLLAQAVPRHWLTDGKQVKVENAPTEFGALDYTIDSHVNDRRIVVHVDPPKRTPPEAIVVYLRHPAGKPIKVANANGTPIKEYDAGSITLRGVDEPVTVEVRYE
ncbi:MAG: hypothetical protein RBS80_29305, partial [Thermoguttaceae bacterium]|nr:hypothetical protein [Thermoguttaceae bacterium]